MEWFSRQLWKDRASETAPFGPQALLQVLAKGVPRYLDDVDQGKLIYPACKRAPGDVDGNLGSIWDHTRLEAMRYVMVVPRREFQLLAEPSRQPEMVEAYLRQRPHEDTVIEFTGSTMGDLAIAVIAGFNWLNRCATLVEVNRERFSGTLNNFRKIAVLAQQWWAMDGAAARCGQMLLAQQIPEVMLYLVWQGYNRVAKGIDFAGGFGPSIERGMENRGGVLDEEFAGRAAEIR